MTCDAVLRRPNPVRNFRPGVNPVRIFVFQTPGLPGGVARFGASPDVPAWLNPWSGRFLPVARLLQFPTHQAGKRL